MIKKLGFADVSKGYDWVSNLNFMCEKWNGKVNSSGRECLWYGREVSLGFNSYVSSGLEIPRGLKIRGNELWGGDDWNSILVYKYKKGCELKVHTDRNVFDKKVVLVNFCRVSVGFQYDDRLFWLGNGEVIEFDNSVPHGVLKVTEQRFSVSFRKVL